MKRRALLNVAAAGVTPLVRAQAAPRRIGVLALVADYPRFDEWRAFVNEMVRRGHREGREVVYIHRAAGADSEPAMSRELQRAAQELLDAKVDLIYVVDGDAAIRHLQQLTRTVPVVVDRFYLDPVARGLVASLAKPGANVTGNSVLTTEIEAKMVEFLLEATGPQQVVGYLDAAQVLTWPFYPRVLEQRRELGRTRRFTPVMESVSGVAQLDAALGRLMQKGVRAVKFEDPEFFVDHRAQVAATFTARRLAAVSSEPAYTRLGLLLTFGWDVERIARRSAAYVDRILRDTRPQDLPIEQVSTFKLGVHLGTARAIGVRVPPTLLARADEVIE